MSSSSDVLRAFDESRLQKFHWRAVLTTGMGFFTDAYDLFIIGTVTAILTPLWHLSTAQLAVLNSTSLAAAALGALVFGRLMDILGRRAMYGVEVILLTLGAVLSALAPSFAWLVAFRAMVGFGVGGDYPSSSVIMSEYSNRKNRGFLVTLVFSMQGLGLLAGPLVASLLLSTGIPHSLAWRLMLGLGAVPAASVIYLRRTLKETPRYLLDVKQNVAEAVSVVADLTGAGERTEAAAANRISGNRSIWTARNLVRLLGTCGSWFLIDVAFYGNGVSSQLILKALLPGAPLVQTVLVAAAVFLVAALPGYYLAAFFLDRIGRKTVQTLGFGVMAVAYLAIFLVPGVVQAPLAFLTIYAVSYFFIEFGPNTTTFVVPAEVFPTNIRGTAHGLSAASGKIGAFLGAFVLPLVLKQFGLSPTMGMLALVSALGAALTVVTLPEMKQRSLEENEAASTTQEQQLVMAHATGVSR